MEFTEDMLRRIAFNIADLKVRVSLVGHLIAQESPVAQQFERVVQEAVGTPDFHILHTQIFEQLKGGH